MILQNLPIDGTVGHLHLHERILPLTAEPRGKRSGLIVVAVQFIRRIRAVLVLVAAPLVRDAFVVGQTTVLISLAELAVRFVLAVLAVLDVVASVFQIRAFCRFIRSDKHLVGRVVAISVGKSKVAWYTYSARCFGRLLYVYVKK